MQMKTGKVKQLVKGWSVTSLSNGTLLVEPHWIPEPYDAGCSPVGVLTRLALADWLLTILSSKVKP